MGFATKENDTEKIEALHLSEGEAQTLTLWICAAGPEALHYGRYVTFQLAFSTNQGLEDFLKVGVEAASSSGAILVCLQKMVPLLPAKSRLHILTREDSFRWAFEKQRLAVWKGNEFKGKPEWQKFSELLDQAKITPTAERPKNNSEDDLKLGRLADWARGLAKGAKESEDY